MAQRSSEGVAGGSLYEDGIASIWFSDSGGLRPYQLAGNDIGGLRG